MTTNLLYSFKTVFKFIGFILILCLIFCTPKKETKQINNKTGMIMDRLENAGQYFELHPAFEQAFTFLLRSDLAELPVGRHDINGDSLFCLISKGPGKTRTEARLEAHRKYIDIQYIIAGSDEMGWKSIDDCSIQGEVYNEEKDIEFFGDVPTSWTKVPAGSFTVFFPQDAHAPMVSDAEIHKVVMKIAVE